MTIGNIAFIDWAGRNNFDLSAHLKELDEQAQEAMFDAYDYAMTEPCLPSIKVTNRLNRQSELEKECDKGRLPLTVSIDLRHGFSPCWHEVDYVQSSCGTSFSWETKPGDHLPEFDRKHPLFTILEQLAKETGHEVKAVVINGPITSPDVPFRQRHHNVLVTFYATESVRQPTRYLAALATKMAKWGNAVPA